MTVGVVQGAGTIGVRKVDKRTNYLMEAVLGRWAGSRPTWSTGVPVAPDPAVVALNSTNGGILWTGPSAEPSVPESLRRVRDQSGLTWDEIAGALGVSRRTVHNWLSGMVVSGRHAAKLTKLAQIVNDHRCAGDREKTRGRLIAPNEEGVSVLQRLIRQNTATPKRAGLPVSVHLISEAPTGPPIPTHRSTKIRPPQLKHR